MTDLTTIPDDDLFAEFSRRELHKRHGMFAYMTEHQRDYHALWSGICVYAAKIQHRDGFMAPHAYELRTELHRLIDDRPGHVEVFAINTTFHGKETAFQNHAPMQVAA